MLQAVESLLIACCVTHFIVRNVSELFSPHFFIFLTTEFRRVYVSEPRSFSA